MLPFMQPNKSASVIMAKRKPDGSQEVIKEEGEHSPGLMAAAEDLTSAVHMKDAKAVASALMAAFQIMDSEASPEEDME